MVKKLFKNEGVSVDEIDAFSSKGEEIAKMFRAEKLPFFVCLDHSFYTYDPLEVLVRIDRNE